MTGTATVIAFHAVEEGDGPICIAPSVFERQVKTLLDRGCTLLRADEVVDHLAAGTMPRHAVALTFDDAYASVHRFVLPLLDALGVRATVYPVTNELSGFNRWDSEHGGQRLALVNESQLCELADAGWEVGGHTHTHAALPGLDPERVSDEIRTSTAVIEELCGHKVRTFAYPYGYHDEASRAIAGPHHDACFTIGAAYVQGRQPRDRLPRVEAWYLRQPWQATALQSRLGPAYLGVRRAARLVGQKVRTD